MIRVATYNAHDCIGRDGVYDPARIARVVATIKADVVALQEITLDHAGDVLATFEKMTGMQAVDGTLFDRGVGRYGNLLLTRHRVTGQRLHDLSCADREPRGMVDVDIDINGHPCRVAATHLGLNRAERMQQIQRIAALLADDARPTVLMGDFNVWWGSKAFAPLIDRGFMQQSLRSFPTWWIPLLALDRVLVRHPAISRRYRRYDDQSAAMASDHFPIIVELEGASAETGK